MIFVYRRRQLKQLAEQFASSYFLEQITWSVYRQSETCPKTDRPSALEHGRSDNIRPRLFHLSNIRIVDGCS